MKQQFSQRRKHKTAVTPYDAKGIGCGESTGSNCNGYYKGPNDMVMGDNNDVNSSNGGSSPITLMPSQWVIVVRMGYAALAVILLLEVIEGARLMAYTVYGPSIGVAIAGFLGGIFAVCWGRSTTVSYDGMLRVAGVILALGIVAIACAIVTRDNLGHVEACVTAAMSDGTYSYYGNSAFFGGASSCAHSIGQIAIVLMMLAQASLLRPLLVNQSLTMVLVCRKNSLSMRSFTLYSLVRYWVC